MALMYFGMAGLKTLRVYCKYKGYRKHVERIDQNLPRFETALAELRKPEPPRRKHEWS